MNNRYKEQMDILFNDFNSELFRIYSENTPDELGLIGLQELKSQYESLIELNNDLLNEARRDDSFNMDDFADLVNYGALLKTNNIDRINEIDKAINIKSTLLVSKEEEKTRIESQKDNLNESLNLANMFLSSLEKSDALETNINSQKEIIASLNNQIESLDNRLQEIDVEIKKIKEGGLLSEYKKIDEQIKEPIEEKNEEATLEEKKESEIKPYFENDVELTQQNVVDYFKGYVGVKPIGEVKDINELAEKVIDEHRFGKFICVYDGFKIYNDKYNTPDEIVEDYKRFKEEVKEETDIKKEEETEVKEEDNTQKNTNIESLLFTGGASLEEITKELGDEPIVELQPEVKEPKIETVSLGNEKENTVDKQPSVEKKEVKKADKIKYAPNSFGALIEQGKLPNISNKELKEICSKLNIPFKNRTSIIPEGKLDRLLNDNDIKLAFNKTSLRQSIQEQSGMYKGLQDDYKRMQRDAEGRIWKDTVKSELSDIKKESDSFESTVKKMQNEEILEQLDLGTRTIKKVDNLDKKKDIISEKLAEQYKKLDSEIAVEKSSKTNISKFFSSHRQNKINKKIERISKKEARITNKQYEIVSTQAKKYMEQRKSDLLNHLQEQSRLQNKIAKSNALKYNIAEAKEQKSNYEKDLREASGIERAALSIGREMTMQRLKMLERKDAIVDRRQQVVFSRKTKKLETPSLEYSNAASNLAV